MHSVWQHSFPVTASLYATQTCARHCMPSKREYCQIVKNADVNQNHITFPATSELRVLLSFPKL